MLDPWIIDEILKKEEEQRREHERGRAEIPVDTYREQPQDKPRVTPPRQDSENERGVVVIDI